MKPVAAIDTSVLIAAHLESDHAHERCLKLWQKGNLTIYSHGLSEAFSTLTGGRIAPRIPASVVAELIKKSVIPYVTPIVLPAEVAAEAFSEADLRGVRGGAIFDLLHLVAAKYAGVERIYTLDTRDFQAFHRPGDVEVAAP